MSQNLSPFQKPVRKIEGNLGINFFVSGSDNAVRIESSSRNTGITDNHERQIFHENLDIANNIAAFCGGGIAFDKNPRLIGDETNTGWIGSSVSTDADFDPPQYIEIRFLEPRRLPKLVFRGVDEGEDNAAQYPTSFKLTIFGRDNKTIYQQSYKVVENNLYRVVDGELYRVADNRLCEDKKEEDEQNQRSQVEQSWSFEGNSDFEGGVVGVRLDILRWNIIGVLPRITYFAGEMHEWFSGDQLQSIEVLEEKTGKVDSLSYGLSANYCKAKFINRNRMFHKPHNFELLRRNRSLRPRIKCGDADESLGVFFSEEWSLDDSSSFMSCKAYDILFSLRDLIVNYGLAAETTNDGELILPIKPYRDVYIRDLIRTFFDRIEKIRRANGLFEPIDYDLKLLMPVSQNIQIPYVLIEEQSAWQVLSKIASLLCAYVYADRNGRVCFSEDNFGTRRQLNTTSSGSLLNKSYQKIKASFVLRNKASIDMHGLHEYNYDATLFATAQTSRVPSVISAMAQLILDKYSDGVNFVETEWKGDAELKLDNIFYAESIHEREQGIRTPKYECLSNELTLEGGFRQATKGRIAEPRIKYIADERGNLFISNGRNLMNNRVFSFLRGFQSVDIDTARYTGVRLEPGQQYLIELEYSTTFLSSTVFMVGSGGVGGQFRPIAWQERGGTQRNARIVFTVPSDLPEDGGNLVLRFEIRRGGVTGLTTGPDIRIMDISLKKNDVEGESIAIGGDDPVVKINPDNAFRFSLPVKSRTIVNQVKVEYYVLKPCSEVETIRINERDCVFFDAADSSRFRTIVRFRKVYDSIRNLEVPAGFTYNISKATSNTLEVVFTAPVPNFENFEVRILS